MLEHGGIHDVENSKILPHHFADQWMNSRPKNQFKTWTASLYPQKTFVTTKTLPPLFPLQRNFPNLYYQFDYKNQNLIKLNDFSPNSWK